MREDEIIQNDSIATLPSLPNTSNNTVQIENNNIQVKRVNFDHKCMLIFYFIVSFFTFLSLCMFSTTLLMQTSTLFYSFFFINYMISSYLLVTVKNGVGRLVITSEDISPLVIGNKKSIAALITNNLKKEDLDTLIESLAVDLKQDCLKCNLIHMVNIYKLLSHLDPNTAADADFASKSSTTIAL